MSYFNSTKVKWNFSYCDCFTLKRENSPDFLCMNAMHTSVSSIFVTPLPGILQSLPLKLNFVLEVWYLSRFGVWIWLVQTTSFLKLLGDLTGYNWIYPLSRFFLESISVWHQTTITSFTSMISSNIISLFPFSLKIQWLRLLLVLLVSTEDEFNNILLIGLCFPLLPKLQ